MSGRVAAQQHGVRLGSCHPLAVLLSPWKLSATDTAQIELFPREKKTEPNSFRVFSLDVSLLLLGESSGQVGSGVCLGSWV